MVVRVPLAMHLDLHAAARRSGLSINDLATWCLALGLEAIEDGAKPRGL